MLRLVPNAEAFVACVQAAAAVSDRRMAQKCMAIEPARIPAPQAHLGGFAQMDPEKRRASAAKGGSATKAGRPRGPHRSARDEFGFSLDEFSTYGIIRTKGFTRDEAAEIILAARRATAPKSGG